MFFVWTAFFRSLLRRAVSEVFSTTPLEAAEKLDVASDFGWRSTSSAAVSALF
jgi:hypothetical protein